MQPLYWLVADQIAAGPYPGSPEPGTALEKVRWLAGKGIGAFVDPTEPGEITRFGSLVPYDEAIAAEAPERALRAIVERRRAFGMPFAGDSPQSEAQFQMVWSWEIGR